MSRKDAVEPIESCGIRAGQGFCASLPPIGASRPGASFHLAHAEWTGAPSPSPRAPAPSRAVRRDVASGENRGPAAPALPGPRWVPGEYPPAVNVESMQPPNGNPHKAMQTNGLLIFT